MKIANLIAIATLFAGTTALTSCLGSTDLPTNEVTYTYGGVEACFNLVTDLSTGSINTYDGPTYKFEYDFTGSKVTTQITSLKFSGEYSALSFSLPSLEYTPDNTLGLYITKGTNVVPEASGAAYVFNEFELRTNPSRAIKVNGSYGTYPVYQVSYLISNRYRVTTFPAENVFAGTTSFKSIDKGGDEETYTTVDNVYDVVLNHNKMTATVLFPYYRVSDSNNIISFVVKDVPFTLNHSGFMLATDGDTPCKLYTSSGKEIEGCSLKGLNMASTLATGTSAINFTLDLTGLSDEDESFNVYTVNATLGYYTPVASN